MWYRPALITRLKLVRLQHPQQKYGECSRHEQIHGRHEPDFYCDGCKSGHTIEVESPSARWQWNGDRVKPTISPSILCWLEHRPDEDEEEKKYVDSRRCHSFVREGMIEFLSDCGHELAGKTVPLHPFPKDYGLPENAE